MVDADHKDVKSGLAAHLVRLWRYGLLLSGNRDTAEELVQATCLRALEKSHQFKPDTRLDCWLFAILASIWKNELRAQRIRRGEGFVEAEQALVFDGGRQVETNILARQVLEEVMSLPEAQRDTVFLVYVEGLTYREAAAVLEVPIGTVMSRLAAARATLGRLREDPAERRSEARVRAHDNGD
ncbi:MAG: RNA polymerase sigma factor [Hyphomicrobiales bacterium]|nr:RNA polymerase sigma factor [Hyphomicrobiales bacterium]